MCSVHIKMLSKLFTVGLFALEARSLNKVSHWAYKSTLCPPLTHFVFHHLREMIVLFLLIFALQNGVATGQLTLNDLQVTMNGMNDKINKLEAHVQDLQSEVKVKLIITWISHVTSNYLENVIRILNCIKLILLIPVKTLHSKNQELESIVKMKELEERVWTKTFSLRNHIRIYQLDLCKPADKSRTCRTYWWSWQK